jgi:hypothetical protein
MSDRSGSGSASGDRTGAIPEGLGAGTSSGLISPREAFAALALQPRFTLARLIALSAAAAIFLDAEGDADEMIRASRAGPEFPPKCAGPNGSGDVDLGRAA